MLYDSSKPFFTGYLLSCGMLICLIIPSSLHASRLYDAKLIDKVVEKAYTYYQHRTPYKWGGNAYTGIDCSGLTHISFKAAGIHIPRNSAKQAQHWAGLKVEKADLQKGDLIFFDSNHDGVIDHVGLIIDGRGHSARFIHSSSTNRGVAINRISEAYWRHRYKSGSAKRLFSGRPGSGNMTLPPPIVVHEKPYKGKPPGKYPFTSERYLTSRDLQGLSSREVKIMKNEIFARHGYVFHVNPAMVHYFEKQDWYRKTRKRGSDSGYLYTHYLTEVEKYNVKKLKDFEKRKKYQNRIAH